MITIINALQVLHDNEPEMTSAQIQAEILRIKALVQALVGAE